MERKGGETGGGVDGGGSSSGVPPGSTGPRTPISRRRICAEPPRPPMCASPQRRSLSPRDCATAPQQRYHSTRGVSPPRSDVKIAREQPFKNEVVGMPPYNIGAPSRKKQVPQTSAKRILPYDMEASSSKSNVPQTSSRRRLDFGGKTTNESSEIKNDTETKQYYSAKGMNSSPETSESSKLSRHKRPWLRSSGCVLGTFSIDLDKETVSSSKKCSSTQAHESVNSRENDKTRSFQIDKAATVIAGCSSTCVNHNVFICPRELSGSTPMEGYAVTEKKMIPGGDKETDFLVKKAMQSFDGMIKCVTGAHQMKICFNGNLQKTNFRVTEEGTVKITGAEAREFSKEGAKLDDQKLADIIEFDYFAGKDLLPSIAELLRLLRDGELRQEDAMANNICLMPELQRMSLFEWMLKTMETLEKTDTTSTYTEIMDALETAYSEYWYGWQRRAQKNQYLCKVFEYIDPVTGKGSVYPNTLKGLLRFVRNCIEHLPGHAYNPTTRESLYYLFEIDHIISGTYKGLFEIVQSVLSAAGKACNW